jgi:hypothetical protein
MRAVLVDINVLLDVLTEDGPLSEQDFQRLHVPYEAAFLAGTFR